MAYGFTIARPTALKNRSAVVDALNAAGFTRIDGQPVSAKAWASWLPSGLSPK